MANLNKAFLIGRLTRDPELKYTKSGKSVCELGLAVNYKYGDKEETTFLGVVLWEKAAENACQYLAKGREIFVEGRIKQETYTDRNNQEQTKTKIVAFSVQYLGKADKAATAPSPAEDDHTEDVTEVFPF